MSSTAIMEEKLGSKMSSTTIAAHTWTKFPAQTFLWIIHALQTIFLLTESDVVTWIIPNTAFGTIAALAGPVLTTSKATSFSAALTRMPSVFAWNWLNIVVFDLANQRLPISIAEDRINKPWRPGPSGRLTSTQMRRLLLVAMPIVLAINSFLGAWQETALLFCLTWMYHDLQGGESIVGRNVIISLAAGLYDSGSVRVACGTGTTMNETGIHWILTIAAVILSTMHVQEMKDTAGDKLRNRQTIPLTFGERVGRWSVAVPIFAWSVFCPLYLRVGLLASVLPVTMGAYVAFRALWMQGAAAHRRTWQVWGLWLITLYILPLVKEHNALLDIPPIQWGVYSKVEI